MPPPARPSLRLGLGCMRLLESPDPGAVIAAGLAAGLRWLNTAHAYGPRLGDGERILAEAIAAWPGDRAELRVVTKIGMQRPRGRWLPDGRAKTLRAQAEASAAALGEPADLLLLHAVDPKVALRRSLRALAACVDDGTARAIGVSNVTRHQLDEGLDHAPVAAVEVALSPYADDAIVGGLVERCRDLDIPLLAHSPLGGPRKKGSLARHPALAAVAERRACTPALVALAWLLDLAPNVIPLPGPTRLSSAASLADLPRLDDGDRAELDAALPAGRRLRRPATERRPPDESDGEVVLLMGLMGAGKSLHAAELESDGYQRLNRDEQGGSLAGQAEALDTLLAGGARRVVVDNTHVSRASRGRIVDRAWERGLPLRCRWLDVPIAEAQVNVVRRLVHRYGELPGPERLAALRKRDPQAFDPRALFRMERALEPPTLDEGFTAVERVPFARRPRPNGGAAALVLQCEGVLRRSRSGARSPATPEDVEPLDRHLERLRDARSAGHRVVAFSWQPELAEKGRTTEDVEATWAATRRALGLDAVSLLFCAHRGGPPICWCRPPLPGLLVPWLDAEGVDPAASTLVGHSAADRTLAERLGMTYVAG